MELPERDGDGYLVDSSVWTSLRTSCILLHLDTRKESSASNILWSTSGGYVR